MMTSVFAIFEIFLAHVKALRVIKDILKFRILYLISPRLLDYVMEDPEETFLPSEVINFMGSMKLYWAVARINLAEMRKKAAMGQVAPNPELYNLTKKRWMKLLECGGGFERPLVLIFGSCS